MSKEELRHCPCGGKARVHEYDEVWVECKKCGRHTKYYPEGAREFAIEDWNDGEIYKGDKNK